MARTLLVVPAVAGAGLARTCLDLVRALDRRGVNVAFVKPVAQPRADGGPDRSIALAAATTALRPPDPLSTADLEQQLGSGGLDAVLEEIVAAWQPVHDRSDVVVVEGLSPGSARLYASGLNQALAKAIDADVLLVASWPTAGAATGEDRADRAAEPRLGPAAGTVKNLAESLAITASGSGRVSTHAWSAAWSTACRLGIRRRQRNWARRWPRAGSASSPQCRTVPS